MKASTSVPPSCGQRDSLGRSDLIKQTAGGHQRFQAMDATNLLRPAPDQRDEGLPVAYLAYRLGVAVEQVPRPTTPTTGFKSLAYFDPPATVSRPSRSWSAITPRRVRHACGRRPAARPSDLRCTIRRGEGGAGRRRIDWARIRRNRPRSRASRARPDARCSRGDASKAPHLLLTEGIETGAAVALVFLPEIEQGQVAVAAAISAGGVEAFQPWPATKRVTVAADRDEGAKPDGRPGSRRGEPAARLFGLLCSDRFEIDIALPGVPDESVDWLDEVLHRDGPQAVREGLLAAEPFRATAGEREAAKEKKRKRHGKLEAIARTYPLPEIDRSSFATTSRLRAGPRSTSWL